MKKSETGNILNITTKSPPRSSTPRIPPTSPSTPFRPPPLPSRLHNVTMPTAAAVSAALASPLLYLHPQQGQLR
ncbi:hypothetical protein E2C01_075719 [Portunus trituberculatus]|uniref:Uncharacterized protein n=1 Tax=Portunus trituberculatus TaxID=210409 RepID=A0A5B7IJW1_PORTR|nr:hypothetical protein [Portunus trituberculatus]